MTNEETPADVIAQEVAGGAEEAEVKTAFDAENGSSPHTETGITHSGIPSIAQLLGVGITPEIAKWAKAIEHQRS